MRLHLLLVLLGTTSALCQDVEVAGQRSSSQDAIKVVISEGCVAQADAADGTTAGKELSLSPGSPLVLTHQIRLVPSGRGSGPGSGSGSGSCGCDGDLSALKERIERLEREVSALREKCGDPENPGCCSSRESKGSGCSISPEPPLCPGDCSDQGRCVDGRCQCFPGFRGADCAEEVCAIDCGQRGRCVDGECQCDPGFTGPRCSRPSCPDDCNGRGRCVDGKCVCDSGFGGENCADKTCPGNCNNRGRCVNGKCVCDSGFGGDNCVDKTCPGNCNSRGRCVNGKCVCEVGFSGLDCSSNACPGNCNNRGRCVNGKCVCDSGFGGENCADKTCPGNCNSRGRCVNGKCICDSGFGGDNCADKTCPDNCNNRGRCVNGKCVCDSGFGGESCADKTCPGNCNSRGRCVNGKCVCDSGFGGESCADKTCPGNCNSRGRCVNGKCVCDSGFGGESCADKTCPGNCNSRGRCVNGKCVCDSGFKGEDCAEKACPNDCSGRGKCVNGQCVCEAGFTGADCSAKGCPGNCNSRGRCVKGKCVCRRGFSGPDCGQCQNGLTGPNCDTVMSAVEQLQTKDLTQSSVTVVWTQPPVQYESYLLTFTSQKDSAEVQAQVPGSQSSFTQTGLAPGQIYIVTVTGRTGQSSGAPGSTRFSTLPSGPSDLRVVKTSTSSAVVQWEPSPSDVDRYRLTVSRADGEGRSRELTFDPGASSAHITQLEAGDRYDITLVAEKGRSQSEPVTTHATPGSANVLVSAVTASPSDDDKRNLKNDAKNVKQPGAARADNATKVIKRIQVRPSIPGNNTEPFQPKRVESGTDSESNREITPKEGDAGIGLTTPEPKRTCLNRVKVTHGRLGVKDKTGECKDDGTDDGTAESASGVKESELEPPQVNQQNKDLEISQDHSLAQPHPLEKLLTDTFSNLNVTTFAIQLSEPTNIDENAEILAQQIMQGLKPVPTLKKSIKSLQYPETPQITSLSSERSRTTMGSPTSSIQIAVLTNSETGEDGDTKGENYDDSRTGNERKTPGEGGLPMFRRTPQNRPIIRRLRPNLLQFRNRTGFISRNGDRSLPSSSQINPTSTDGPMIATEKPPLSDENGIDLENDGVSEGVKTKQAKAPGSDRQNLPNMGLFRNRSHPNHRFFRRPMRLLNNKTQTAKPNDEAEAITANEPSSETEKDKLSNGRAGFNRSRVAFPRRPNPYVGPFQNRSRLFLRPPQRGPLRKDWTAESLRNGQQTRQRNSDSQERTETDDSDNVPRFSENLKHRLNISKFTDGDFQIDSINSNNKDVPGKEESTIITQNGEPEHLKGLDTGETDSGKDPDEIFTQRIENEHDEKEEKVDLTENVQKMPQDELQIMENKGSNDMDEEDLSVILDNDRVSKDTGRDIPESLAKQEENGSSLAANSHLATITNHDEQDGIISTRTEGKPAGVDGKQSNSSATVFRRRFKPGEQPIRRKPQHIQARFGAKAGLDPPERNYQNLVATRGEEDADPESKGHGVENVMENENLGSPREEGVSTDQRGEPNRTVIRRLRPNLYQTWNKTPPSSRRGKGSSSTSSKMSPTVTETPVLPAQNPSLSDRKAANVNFNKVFEGEKDEGEAAGIVGESESPGEAPRLDQVFSESDYKVTVLGKGSGVLSRLHKLVISTGPEPPSDLVFDHVTEDSVTVSWTKPKSAVSGFKVTYTHSEEGEPVSVTLDQGNSSVDLSRLRPGSTYEVSILSVLGLDESDHISRTLHTLPDPPTDLRAVNVTESGALLLWRPALAAVEKYTIVYGSGTGSEVRVTVSGNTAEEQLKDLEPSTTYTVTISSELDTRKSKEASTSFTTTAPGSDGAGDLRATHVTPRTARLSWKPPSRPVIGYKVTYQTEGQRKEVSVGSTETQLNLTRLFPGAEYSVELQTEGGGEVLFTSFTTGSLQFPFPSDCSQEQLNGLSVSGLVDIFPVGRQGAALSVWCDMETDGGGWTVFQRRRDGSVDFFRSWKEYVKGFGDPSGEFWLGLDALHTLTTRGSMTLRVDLRDGAESVFAQYSTFEVAKRNYRLTVGGYSGTAGDSMTYHNNRIFSTRDRDPAAFITRCAMSYRGGWWYKNCHEANLNGLYGISSKHQGIVWTSWKGKEASIPFTEMKMRPTDFLPNKNNYRA